MKLQTQHAREKADILGIMSRMEQEFQDTEADAKHEYSSLRDDVKNKVWIPDVHDSLTLGLIVAFPHECTRTWRKSMLCAFS